MTTAGMSSSVNSNAGPRRRMSGSNAVIVSASRSKVISPRAFVKRALGGDRRQSLGKCPSRDQNGVGKAKGAQHISLLSDNPRQNSLLHRPLLSEAR